MSKLLTFFSWTGVGVDGIESVVPFRHPVIKLGDSNRYGMSISVQIDHNNPTLAEQLRCNGSLKRAKLKRCPELSSTFVFVEEDGGSKEDLIVRVVSRPDEPCEDDGLHGSFVPEGSEAEILLQGVGVVKRASGVPPMLWHDQMVRVPPDSSLHVRQFGRAYRANPVDYILKLEGSEGCVTVDTEVHQNSTRGETGVARVSPKGSLVEVMRAAGGL
jgi:hypothetical protein